MRKFLFSIIFLVLFVAIIGGVGVYFFAPTLIKMAIEQGGSQAAGTTVGVQNVDLKFQEGRAALQGLSIANPPGFSPDDNVLTLDQISVAVDPERSSPDLLAITEFRIDKPVVVYEIAGGGNNIGAIQEAFEKNVGSTSGDTGGAEMKFIVDRLVITQGEVQVKTGAGTLAKTDLPEVDLSNVGSAEGGLTGGEIGSVIVSEISGNVAQLVAAGAVKGLVGGAIGTATGAIGGATGVLEDAGGGITEGLSEGLGGGLKKLPGLGGN